MSERSLPSPRPGRRRRAPSMAAAQRRAQLVQTAAGLLARHGAGVTTSQLARAAGVAEGTIFRLFEDKQQLLDEALCAAVDPSGVVQALGALEAGEDPRQRVLAAAERMRAHFTTALPVMHGALRLEPSPAAGLAVGQMFRGLLDATRALFQDELARGRLRGEPAHLSRMLVGVCQSASWQDFFDDGPERLDTASFVDVLLDGCRAPDVT